MKIRKKYLPILVLCQFFTLLSIHAAPRWPLPPIPEFISPLYSETFDESFSHGETAAQLTVGNYILNESWSGYALQRSGVVIPFVVPGMDSNGHTNVVCNKSGALRFWFKPDWSSASIAGGTGPGATALLAELNAVAGKQSAVDWLLQISSDGNSLVLLDADGNALLKAPVSWVEGQPHLITLDYSPKWTALFVDAELAAQGMGVTELPPNLAVLVLGSTLTGENPAGGDFDEFYSFPKPLTLMDVLFCYDFNIGNVTLGPISQEEIAAREKRIAERKAQRAMMPSAMMMSASMSSSLAAGGTSGLLSLGCACNCNCTTGGQVYFTNLTATLTTNQGMVVSFNLAGGTNGTAYGVFTTTNLGSPQWKWIGNAYTCATVYLTNQPADASFYALGVTPPTVPVAWGDNAYGQCDAAATLSSAIEIAGGFSHSIALRRDGSTVAWGDNSQGQTNVPSLSTNVLAIAACGYHNLALKADHTVTNWGVWWDYTPYAMTLPAGLTNIIAIAAGYNHDLALRCDGSVVAWGYYTNEPYAIVPTNLPPAMSVAAGWLHSVALLTNGTVAAWGKSGSTFGWNLTNVPPGLSNVVAIAAGGYHTLALKGDGTVAAWGAGNGSDFLNAAGQSIVPSNLTGVVAIDAGEYYSMALKDDGSVVMWGGLSLLGYQLDHVFGIGAGAEHALALRAGNQPPIITKQPINQVVPVNQNATFTVQALGLAPLAYQWQFNAVDIASATNSSLTLTNVNTSSGGNYRVIVGSGTRSTASSNATLVAVTPPVITSFSPATNLVVFCLSNLAFEVTPDAPGQTNGFPISYAWSFNGVTGIGATSSNYSFVAVLPGTCSVFVSNAAGGLSFVWQVTVDYTGSYIDVGTLAYHLSTNAVAHTNGFSGSYTDRSELSGWGHGTYTNADLALLTNSVWSTNFWLKGVQGLSATCIGLSNAYSGQGLATMVSPRHCLYADHVHGPPGFFMAAFLGTNNVIYWRTNMENAFIGNDTSVGILDADLPSSVGYLLVVPTNLFDYLPTNSVSLFQGIGMNQDLNLFSQPMAMNTQYVTWNSKVAVPFGLTTNWNAPLRGGDSSAPERFLINQQLVLLTHNSGPPVGNSYVPLINAINQGMHYLSTNNNVGTDYQLTQFSLTNWPTIH